MGKKNAKQNFLQGAFILVLATVLVKVVGAIFKIPLKPMIGGVASGFFSSAYGLFTPIYSICVAGLPIAVSRMVAETSARGRYRDSRKIFRLALVVFFVVGFVAMLIIAVFAKPFVTIQKSPGAIWAVLAIAPAVFFGCIMSAYRGYYEGLRNMTPTATSQLIEAVAKLIVGLSLAFVVVQIGTAQYEAGGAVFGTSIQPDPSLMGDALAEYISDHIQIAAAPYSALAATLGVTASTLVGTVVLMLRHKIRGDGITREELAASPKAMSTRTLFMRLLKIAIPVSLGSLAVNLTSMIDLFSIKTRLNGVAVNHTDVIMQMYGAYMPAGIPVEKIADELWGLYSVAVLSLFNLVPSLCVAFGKSALPNVTASWAQRDIPGTKRNIESVLRITSLLAIPAGIGLSVLSKPILSLLFDQETVYIGGPILTVLGFACIFVSIVTPMYNMLQAVGRVDIPVKLMLLGAAIKLVMNFTLIGIPQINIRGAAFGTLACYMVIFAFSLYFLCKETKVVPNFSSVFFKPLIAAILMGAAAWACNGLLGHFLNTAQHGRLGAVVTLVSIVLGGLIYVISLILLRAISKDDILMLPKGEKIAKVLEKRGIIG